MKKNFIFIGIVVIIIVGGLVYLTILNYQKATKEKGELLREFQSQDITTPSENPSQSETPQNETPKTEVTKALEGKSIVMIIAFRDFRDEEYFIPKQIFLAAGAKLVSIASTQNGTAIGTDGGEAPINLLIKDVNVSDFDAVVFIGGSGTLEYLNNEDSYKIAREAVSQDKLLAAICISPTILAKAGVLEGKKATVWSSPMDKSAVKILEDNGAIYQSESVVMDGKIITADGPAAAEDFGMKIVEVLTSI